MYERLLKILNAVGTPRVLLVGDFMLDNYLMGNIDRISPEAPVTVMNVTERQYRPGGAGSVAADLSILQTQLRCLGVIGDDDNGRRLRDMLKGLDGVDVDGLVVSPGRATTSKQRIIGLAQHRHRQQLMRIDEETVTPINQDIQDRLIQHLDKSLQWCDVLCLEDYNKGVLCDAFTARVIAMANKAGKKVIIDPASINDYTRYKGAWLVKPNRRELALAGGMEIDTAESCYPAARKLYQQYGIENIVVTLDKAGAYLYQGREDKGQVIPTRPRSVYDVTGAGDMVLAALGMLIAASYDGIEQPTLAEIVSLANIAGGLEVERFGCVGISRAEIAVDLSRQRRITTGQPVSLETLLQGLQWHRRQKHRIVFTNGCFDLLHPGHIDLLRFAKAQGDTLIVAINSDSSVRQLKGKTRPILKQQDRAALLSALEMVDYVTVFDELDPLRLIEAISPDVLIKGADWQGAVVGQDWVRQHGGKVVLMPLAPGYSTTNIIDRVVENFRIENSKQKT